MNITGIPRLFASIVFLLLLGGCAGPEQIVGKFSLELRPEDKREAVYFPSDPEEVPRYRYLGELIGDQNFEIDRSASGAERFFKWVAGLFERPEVVDLRRPMHGAVADNGRIYVVDPGRPGVVVFDPVVLVDEKADSKEQERSREAAAKNLGQMQLWEMATTTVRFDFPVAMAVVWDGDIAVSDAKLGFVSRLNNRGEPVAKLGDGQLKRPTGVAFDRKHGLLYVADSETHEIKVFDAAGQLVRTMGGQGDEPGKFNAPTHLAFVQGSQGGNLYVSDSLNSRIQVFDEEGRYMRSFGARGLNVGDLPRPKGVAVSEAGIVYAVESYFAHLIIYNEHGQLLLAINTSGLPGGEFRLPSGVWMDDGQRVFLADTFNGRVVVYQFLGDDQD